MLKSCDKIFLRHFGVQLNDNYSPCRLVVVPHSIKHVEKVQR